jgi:hypothetical protein
MIAAKSFTRTIHPVADLIIYRGTVRGATDTEGPVEILRFGRPVPFRGFISLRRRMSRRIDAGCADTAYSCEAEEGR